VNFHNYVVLSLPHLLAGSTGLIAGCVALYAFKGGALHRRSGLIFTCAMLAVSVSGIVMAVVKAQRFNLIGGLLTFYMVTTAIVTMRRKTERPQWYDIALFLWGIATVVLGITTGLEAANSPSGRIDGLPPAPAFLFAFVAAMAVAGDARLMLTNMRARRVPRHLWRMCFALFSAAGSFFPAQVPKMIPSLRGSPLLIVPVVGFLVAMFFWMARVRFSARYAHFRAPIVKAPPALF
jgi:uncharacterized membrane protein